MTTPANSWQSVLVPPDASGETALCTLDEGGLRLVLVVDRENHLLGIVTDGDIRRALLRRFDFAAPVTGLMNPEPFCAPAGTPRDTLRNWMEQRSLLHIPIVDDEKRLIALETYRDLLTAPVRDNWVFLMAGGFGTRLGALTQDCPKPMLPVGGKPMLESILENFVDAGFRRFCISVHYLAERIKQHFGDGQRWGVEIRYVEEQAPLGTAGALGLLPETGGLPVLMMNGDVLTQLDFNALLDFHLAQQAAVTLCVREYDMQVPFGVVEGEHSRVIDIVEKPVHRFFVNAGIYVVSPEVVATTVPPRRIDMPDLVKQVLATPCNVAMFPIHEYWLDIGRPDDFERAQKDILS